MNPPALAAGALLPTSPARPSLFVEPGAPVSHQVDFADAQRILYGLLPPPQGIKRVPVRLWWWVAAAGVALALLGALCGVVKRLGGERSMPASVVVKGTVVDAVRGSSSAVDDITPSRRAARIESEPQPEAPASHEVAAATRNTRVIGGSVAGVSARKSGKNPAQTAAVRTPPSPIQHRADSDVDLLEALVVHVSGRPASHPPRQQEP